MAPMFQAGQRVKVDLSGMVVRGVSFSQNVRPFRGTMRLSEAILLGAMMRPQAFRALLTDDRACALGGALLAVGATAEPALRSVRNRWPWAFIVSANCPDCGRSCPVFGVITHLNDNHRWTREQVATWVAGIEPTDLCPTPHSGNAGGKSSRIGRQKDDLVKKNVVSQATYDLVTDDA
jgi:hypothetical protein